MNSDNQKISNIKDSLFILFQYITPQHLLSRVVGFLARSQIKWLKNLLINTFIDKFNVNMSEALKESTDDYIHFNDFFCRQLKLDARPIDETHNSIVCPADGAISQIGPIQNGRIFQAKGQDFSSLELLGGDQSLSEKFDDGTFSTIYLSPKDYHRIHMPATGTLVSMHHIPGALFSVNKTTSEKVPRLFARNERVVCIFNTEYGPMAMVLVGAMIVASIDTVWAGQVAPTGQRVQVTHYDYESPLQLTKGQEMGRFKLGSTVVLLFPKGNANWDHTITANSPVYMGQSMGSFTNPAER